MHRSLLSLVAAALLLSACAQAAPTPTPAPAKPVAPTVAPAAPTAAPAAPAKAAEPTKAPAPAPTAAPTAAPAKAVSFPEKGKSITLIMPWAAGGPADLGGRILAASLEKEIGVAVQVVNKPGASSQTGMTEVARAKPDGYTIGYPSLPTTINTYLDKSRQAVYGRKDFQPLANHVLEATVVAAKVDGPFKGMKDVFDAAKANPEKIKIGTSGLLSIGHLTGLAMQRVTGAKFAFVHFDSAAQSSTALMGGNLDIVMDTVGAFTSAVKSGNLRVIGIMDKAESPTYPGVKTLNAQGYPVEFFMSRGVAMPAGAPKEIVDTLGNALKKAMESDEHKKRLGDMGMEPRYIGVAEYTNFWISVEEMVKPLVEMAAQAG